MSRFYYLKIAILVFVSFWVIESILDSVIWRGESWTIIPHDIHEWWHRGVTLVCMLLFGGYADFMTKKALNAEHQKTAVYHATVFASFHIVNNFINQSKIMEVAAGRCEGFSERALKSYAASIAEAQELLRKLDELEHITEDGILSATVPSHEVLKNLDSLKAGSKRTA